MPCFCDFACVSQYTPNIERSIRKTNELMFIVFIKEKRKQTIQTHIESNHFSLVIEVTVLIKSMFSKKNIIPM